MNSTALCAKYVYFRSVACSLNNTTFKQNYKYCKISHSIVEVFVVRPINEILHSTGLDRVNVDMKNYEV